jgi:hypothetical protein
MVRRMRVRLQKFLPVVLIALAMQVLAPIAACWAAGIATGDPLQTAAICHNAGPAGTGQDDQSGAPAAHTGSCSICCLAQASASLDSPQAAFSIPLRHAERVVWHDWAASVVAKRGGSNAKARAPPHLT